MNRIVLRSKVSTDGIVHLSVPVGLEEADRDVQVTVELIAPKSAMTREERQAWVDSVAGTWQGNFERLPQQLLPELGKYVSQPKPVEEVIDDSTPRYSARASRDSLKRPQDWPYLPTGEPPWYGQQH